MSNSIAEALALVVRGFYQKGWCPATSSNFSYRLGGQEGFWVSQSGVDKENFAAEHFLEVSLEGKSNTSEPRKPSAETLLHSLVYRLDSSARSVLHVHSPLSAVMSLKYPDKLLFEGFEVQKGIFGQSTHHASIYLPIFANDQDMPRLSQQIEPILEDDSGLKGFLLAGHGLYAWGRSVPEAKRHVEVYQYLMQCLALQSQLGG